MAFDRAAHCQRIGHGGGLKTVERYGIWHMRAIGKAGAQSTIARHGYGYWRGLVDSKGYRGPQETVVRLPLSERGK